MAQRTHPFDQIVFSGGGLRCFRHGGWMRAVEREGHFRPERVTGVPGGALSAAAWIRDRERDLAAIMKDAFRGEHSNVGPGDLDHDATGRTPHQGICRKVVDRLVTRKARDAIAESPSLRILLAHPPREWLTQITAMLAGTVYEPEKRLLSRPRSSLPELIGMDNEPVDARRAARGDGMIYRIPMPSPDRGQTLLPLSRDCQHLRQDMDWLHHVTPSRKPVDGRSDFTDPSKVEEACALGEKDGLNWPQKTNTRKTT